MIVKLKKDHEGFGKAGDELEVNRVRGLAWIEEGIAEDPRKEKSEKASKKEKKDNAGPNGGE